MALLKERIVEKLDQLSEPKLREVLNFIEFLTWRTTDQEDPLLAIAGMLSSDPLSSEQIEQELYGNQEVIE